MLDILVAGFVLPMLISATLVPIIRSLAPVLGLVDQPGFRKVHFQPTPRSGGIAVWSGIACTLILIAGAWRLDLPLFKTQLQTLVETLQSNAERTQQLTAVAIGACLLFFVGLADDRWNLSWRLRLTVQLGVAVGVAAAGVKATVFASQPWIGFAATVLWIIVLTNAMNFLDNMDALSAGIGVIASLMFAVILVVMIRTPMWSVALSLVMLAGSLTGFLFWNRPPASIFMGDCGSNLIGFLLATLTIVGTFYDYSGSRHVILAPICVLAIPLYDFCTVIFIRLKQGRSPFHGDKSHFSHRLVELGLRPAPAVLTIHLCTLMTGLGGILLYKVSDWTGTFLVLALIVCILGVVAILETVGRHSVSQVAALQDNPQSPVAHETTGFNDAPPIKASFAEESPSAAQPS